MGLVESSRAETLDANPIAAKHETTLVDDTFVTGDTLTPDQHDRATSDGRTSGRPGTIASSRRSVIPRVVEERGVARLVTVHEERYRLDDVIGAGGMGEVARAFDRDIGRTVAVKRMLADVTGPKLVAQFVDEVRTLGRLHHPNIVPIHDVDLDPNGQLFFTMPLVDGSPLDTICDRLAKGDEALVASFPFSRRLDIFAGIVDALGHAHARDIVHRDVKPPNVMVGPFGEVVLLDWGIARLGQSTPTAGEASTETVARATDKTRVGQILGTPRYMAPEQARGEVDAIGPATDLYAAFVVLFELLTLTSYVKAPDTTLALLEVAAKEPPSPLDDVYSGDGPKVPVEFRHFLRHGLAHDPSARYSSASAVLDELARIRSGDFKVECLVTFAKRTGVRYFRWLESYPRFAIAVTASIAITFVVALVFVGVTAFH